MLTKDAGYYHSQIASLHRQAAAEGINLSRPDFTVSLERERKRIRELEDLLILIRDRWDCSREVEPRP